MQDYVLIKNAKQYICKDLFLNKNLPLTRNIYLLKLLIQHNNNKEKIFAHTENMI